MAAEKLALQIVECERINAPETLDWFREYRADLMVVASFGEWLSESLLQLPRFGGINIHPSLLPKYRGASPVQYALLNGDSITGVTIYQVRKKMDAGEILGQVTIAIEPADDHQTLHERLAHAAAPLLNDVIRSLEQGTVTPEPQDESRVVMAPKIQKEDGRIDWTCPADKIVRQIRAFSPWPGAFTFYPVRSKLLRINITRAEVVEQGAATGSGLPGELLAATDRIDVACGEGSRLSVLWLQREGRKAMPADAFLRGLDLKPGTAFVRGEDG